MGVEVVVASDAVTQVPLEAVTEVDMSILHKTENGKLDKDTGPNEAVKIGSHEREVEMGVGIDVADANARRNAASEWAIPKAIHNSHVIKIPSYFDPTYKPQIEEFDRGITKINEALNRAYGRLRAKKDARSELFVELKTLKTRGYEFRDIMDEKRKEMQPLQEALGKFRNNGTGRGGIYSSEEELDEAISRLQYRIEHESSPLSEEKQLVREIKQLEESRPSVIAYVAMTMTAKIPESLGPKDEIQDQVKHMNVDFDGVKKENNAIWENVDTLKEKVEAIDDEIKVIEEERADLKLKRDALLEDLRKIREQSDLGNAPYFANRRYLNQVKVLAVNKDVQAIQQLVNAETDKFMLAWSNDKAFREDYEKRIVFSGSLDRRQLSRDGRIRSFDEKPIVVLVPPPSRVEPFKKPEEPKPAPNKESLPARKVQEKTEEEEEVAGLEKAQQETPPPEVDLAKLKEMKREEEIAKAKLAMERKKKLAEKAAAKAAKRAEKEAEKKLKDREKKLKKKSGVGGQTKEEEKAGEEGSESDETKEAATAAVAVKELVKRENPVRYRNRHRELESVPKALLKRKKATNSWLCAATAAMIAAVLVVLVYYYLL